MSGTACDLCAAELQPRHVAWIKDGFEVARCAGCGLVQRRSRPTSAELAAIYGPAYFAAPADDVSGQGYDDYLAAAESHREQARRRLDLLGRRGDRGPLLDVGAAAGFFVAEAQARGWDARGVDVSEEMAAWARTELGVRVDGGVFTGAIASSGSLAAVTMWDYLEHSISPRRDLATAAALLRAGGLLALSTGDVESAVARASGSRWHLLTPRHHNFFFGRTTLRRYLADAGFEVLYEGHPGARYTLRYLVHKARTIAPGRLADALSQRVARSRLGGLALPVNLGDILTVVARRREGR